MTEVSRAVGGRTTEDALLLLPILRKNADVQSGEHGADLLSTAVDSFDAWRSNLLHERAESGRRPSEPDVIDAEWDVAGRLARLHASMSEHDQLLVYRFFLTAVHLQSVRSLDRHPMSERHGGESEEISRQLDALVDDVVAGLGREDASVRTSRRLSRAKAGCFLWTFVWWTHAREDVSTFMFDRSEDESVLYLLGRVPDRADRIAWEVYRSAAVAESLYADVLSAPDEMVSSYGSVVRSRSSAQAPPAGTHP